MEEQRPGHSTPEEFAVGKFGTRIKFSSFQAGAGCDESVLFDVRNPTLERFAISCMHRLQMDGRATAGNHYHNERDELLIPETGSFQVTLLGIGTLERAEEFHLSAAERDGLFVPRKVGHRIIALEQPSSMLVLSSAPDAKEDMVKFDLAARMALTQRKR